MSSFDFDVLKPDIISIGKRKYRKIPFISKGKAEGSQPTRILPDFEDEDCELETEVEQTEKGYMFKLTGIPSYYFKFVCGKQNENKKRIEKQTGSHILLPKPGNEGNIVINGPSRTGVLSAKSQIELLVESARARQKPTHFMCFALNESDIKDNFRNFKQIVLDNCFEDRGIDESIFQNPDRLHLTLGMMVLVNLHETNQALEKLKSFEESFKRDHSESKPLTLNVQGIEYMNDDPAEVDVLYAKVHLEDNSNRLQNFVDMLVDFLATEGLMKREYEHVKLHATIMNTIFREENAIVNQTNSRTSRHSGGKRKQRATFDARQIIELCGDFYFGQVTLTTCSLSARGKYDADGFYESNGNISLNF